MKPHVAPFPEKHFSGRRAGTLVSVNNLRDRPRAGVGAGRPPDSRSRDCPSAGWPRLPVPVLAAGLASAHESLVSLCGEQACVVFPPSHILARGGLLCALNAQGSGCAWGPRQEGPYLPACPPGFPIVKRTSWGQLASLAFTRTWTVIPVGHTERTGVRLCGCEGVEDEPGTGAHRRPARGSLHWKQSPRGSRKRPGANLETN